MSELKDWEPEMITEINWETQYDQQFRINELLCTENNELKKSALEQGNLLRKLQSDCENYKKTTEQEFRQLKADAVISLKAIDLCILASLNTDKQTLTHRARNFRMRHVHQIICNEIDALCDRKLTSYEDDF